MGVGVVHLGVPVAVEEDDGVRSEQVDPLSSCPGRETEDEEVGLRSVEHVDVDLCYGDDKLRDKGQELGWVRVG